MNSEERGIHIGAFKGEDKILTIMQSGHYRLMNYDLSNHFDEDMILIEKFDKRKIISAIYFDAEQGKTYIKRFNIDPTSNGSKKNEFIPEHPENKLISISLDYLPVVEVIFDGKINAKDLPNEIIKLGEFIGVKSYKAKGKRVSNYAIKNFKWLEPEPFELPPDETKEEELSAEQMEKENNETEAVIRDQEVTETKPKANPDKIDLDDPTQQMSLEL